jgi:hypothetical protein
MSYHKSGIHCETCFKTGNKHNDHFTKTLVDGVLKVTCPTILAFKCGRCGGSGHSRGHCNTTSPDSELQLKMEAKEKRRADFVTRQVYDAETRVSASAASRSNRFASFGNDDENDSDRESAKRTRIHDEYNSFRISSRLSEPVYGDSHNFPPLGNGPKKNLHVKTAWESASELSITAADRIRDAEARYHKNEISRWKLAAVPDSKEDFPSFGRNTYTKTSTIAPFIGDVEDTPMTLAELVCTPPAKNIPNHMTKPVDTPSVLTKNRTTSLRQRRRSIVPTDCELVEYDVQVNESW